MLNYGFRAFFLALLFILAAGCTGPAASTPLKLRSTRLATSTQPPQSTATLSATPDRLGTSSAAYDLTATQRALTPSLTPTATVFRTPRPTPTQTLIPSITPTYDYSHFITLTPAPAARCPVFTQAVAPTPAFENPDAWTVSADDILDYLNRYGPDALIQFYQHQLGKNYIGRIEGYADYTGDGVKDLAVGWGNFYIFGCKAGEYVLLNSFEPIFLGLTPDIIKIIDANRNGVPEISLSNLLLGGGHSYTLIEWDEDHFVTVLNELFTYNPNYFSVEDIDRDGYFEYVLNEGIPDWNKYRYGIPWRNEKVYFRWNGIEFNLDKVVFSPAEYRFQAIQDGERSLVAGESDKALEFYRQAIYNQQLGWWTPDRAKYVMDEYENSIFGNLTPVLPQPDLAEYDAIAAYARFKIMLIYVSRGWLADAKILYDNIQRDYPPESTAHSYAELAAEFWTEFNRSQDIAAGCKSAIKFAKANSEEIYIYIGGGDYFGTSALNYKEKPEYICPFQ